MLRYSRLGAEETGSVYTIGQQAPSGPVSPEFWLSPPQNIRAYMPNITEALNFFSKTLDSIISYYNGIVGGDSTKFDWYQAQYALDRMSLIQAIQSVIQSLTAGQPIPEAYQSTVDTINAKLAKVNDLYAGVLKLNPDIGQAATLQAIYTAKYLEAKKTGAPLPQKIQFTPAFTPGASPVVTVEPDTGGMGIGTVAVVLIGGFLAYQALR
jgi:hypothetical protein